MSERIPGARGLCARAVIVYLLRLAILAAPYVIPVAVLAPCAGVSGSFVLLSPYVFFVWLYQGDAIVNRFCRLYVRLSRLGPADRVPAFPLRLDLARAVACMHDRRMRCWMFEIYSGDRYSLRTSLIVMLESPLIGWLVQRFLYPKPPDMRLLEGVDMIPGELVAEKGVRKSGLRPSGTGTNPSSIREHPLL